MSAGELSYSHSEELGELGEKKYFFAFRRDLLISEKRNKTLSNLPRDVGNLSFIFERAVFKNLSDMCSGNCMIRIMKSKLDQ